MTANEVAAKLFQLCQTIDGCVHGGRYLDSEIDQLFDAYNRLTRQYVILLGSMAEVDARDEAERQAVADAIDTATNALTAAETRSERAAAIAGCFDVSTRLKALLPSGNLLA